VKNSGHANKNMCSASDAINGWKRVGGGYAGFSAIQSKHKKSKVEIQTRSFMASTLCPSPVYQMLKMLSQQNLK